MPIALYMIFELIYVITLYINAVYIIPTERSVVKYSLIKFHRAIYECKDIYGSRYKKAPANASAFSGGDGEIRTLVPVKANAFRVRPVMTASIRLRIFNSDIGGKHSVSIPLKYFIKSQVICQPLFDYLLKNIQKSRFRFYLRDCE